MLSFCKNAFPYFFHGVFAPSFIWSRRPWFAGLRWLQACICMHLSPSIRPTSAANEMPTMYCASLVSTWSTTLQACRSVLFMMFMCNRAAPTSPPPPRAPANNAVTVSVATGPILKTSLVELRLKIFIRKNKKNLGKFPNLKSS